VLDASQSAAAATRIFLPRLVDGAAAGIKAMLTRWNFVKGISRLQRVRLIKPIWNPGKEGDIHEFYYPCPISVSRRKVLASGLDDLGADHVVITGRVGQGKSMLLRFLASNELESFGAGDHEVPIPLFLELRQFTSGGLREFVLASLTEIGLECDASVFEYLAKRKQLALLLDGFDEVPTERRPQMLTDLERLRTRYEGLRIVVTSRPNISGIEHLSGFATRKLLDLDAKTRAGLIRKQYGPDQSDTAEGLILELGRRELGKLVTSPLMSVLVVIHYNTYQKLPETVAGFHEDLFDALLRRHDATKPGFVRPRASKMDDLTFRTWFDRLAFRAMKSGAASWARHGILEMASDALPLRGVAAGADDVLDDAVNITGLIVQEGGEYQFVHKSIVEYHAASCVKRLSDRNAKRFYSRMRVGGKWIWWEEVLRFLMVIDRVRYLRYFEAAQYCAIRDNPSLQGIFGDSGLVFVGNLRQLKWRQEPWLRRPAGQKLEALVQALERYLIDHAPEFTYDEFGELSVESGEFELCERDPKIELRLGVFVAWCHKKLSAVQAEVAQLDGVDELLDLDDNDDHDQDS
jgi:hypothetical protein